MMYLFSSTRSVCFILTISLSYKYSMGQENGLPAFDYNSAKSEPIWVNCGALWAHCWRLDLADFGRDMRSSNSQRGSRNFVCFFGLVYNARFPIGQILRHLSTTTTSQLVSTSVGSSVWAYNAVCLQIHCSPSIVFCESFSFSQLLNELLHHSPKLSSGMDGGTTESRWKNWIPLHLEMSRYSGDAGNGVWVLNAVMMLVGT